MTEIREMHWDGLVNARDLGGLGRIRLGALVRMEAPTRLTDAGWAAAWDYGVHTIVDLRNADERPPDQAPRPTGIEVVRAPQDPVGTPFFEKWSGIDSFASPLYFGPLLAEHPELIIAAIRAVAIAAPGGVAFHCAGGKDRTGLLALVLLVLAGASPQEIIEDYLRSYQRMQPTYTAMGAPDQLAAVRRLLAARDSSVEASLTSTIDWLRNISVPSFLLENGLTETELTALEARILR